MGSSLAPTREAARMAAFDYIEGFYNPIRRHSSIGYMSPADYERATAEEVKVA
jgi:putative transposase